MIAVRRFRTLLVPLGAVLLLSGCHRQPVGQVVAVVGDDEITRAELNAELQTAGDGQPDARQAALGRLVDRRLLAHAARADRLDKSQDYLIRARELADALLGQMLAEEAGRALPLPSDREIDAYLRSHRATLADRGLSSPSEAAVRSAAVQAIQADGIRRAVQQRLAAERARTRITVKPDLAEGAAP